MDLPQVEVPSGALPAMCKKGLHPDDRRYWDGAQWRCHPCRRASQKVAVDRYRSTAKGILNDIRTNALQRGT